MIDFAREEVRRYYENRIPGIKFTNAKEIRCKCPVHHGDNDNFAVDASTGMAHCHSECGRGWDILGLEMELSGRDFPTCKKEVFSLIGRPEPAYQERDIVATFDYIDAEGNLRYQVVRRHPKRFSQRRPDGNGRWINSLGEMERVPFNLPAVIPSPTCVIVEGEKDVLTLKRMGVVASCNSEGAGKWREELSQYFVGKRVVIIPDNDKAGRDHSLKVAASLYGKASRIQIVELPDMPEKADVSDFFAAGRTMSDLKKCIADSQDYTPEFQFVTVVPHTEDQWVYSIPKAIDERGGRERFWDLASHDGIPTPFAELTEILTGGFRNGEVYILAGPRKLGKTSLALQFLSKFSKCGKGGILFSLEMGKEDVIRRMVSIEERVNLTQVRILQRHALDRVITPGDEMILRSLMAKLYRGEDRVRKYPLLVHQKPAASPAYLISEAKRLAERQKIDYICVDHAQLMGSTGNQKQDYEKFTAISRALKGEVARELQIPLFIISQVSRNASFEKRNELEVTDLRATGAWEEDSAAILLLYHDQKHSEELKARGELGRGPIKSWLKVGANRFGEDGAYIELTHWKTFTRFESNDERDWEPDLPAQSNLEVA